MHLAATEKGPLIRSQQVRVLPMALATKEVPTDRPMQIRMGLVGEREMELHSIWMDVAEFRCPSPIIRAMKKELW